MDVDVDVALGFTDSTLLGYERHGSSVTVNVRAWNHRLISISFDGAIALRDTLAGSFSAAVVDSPLSQRFVEDALAVNFSQLPQSHPYHAFSLLSDDDVPSLEVVAIGWTISVRESS